MQAQIEIRSRNVKGVPEFPYKGYAQHLFIIYTDSAEKEIVLRGGPGKGNTLLDDLKVIKVPYGEKVNSGKPSVDFINNAPSQIIATGTDEEIQAYVDKMWVRAEENCLAWRSLSVTKNIR